MPYLDHSLLAFGGKLSAFGVASADEIWECTLRLVDPDLLGPVQDPGFWINSIAEDFSDFICGTGGTYGSGPGNICNYATFEWLKCNSIGPNGRYLENTANTVTLATPKVGSATPVHPVILSLSMTWRSDVARGVGARGHMFLPNASAGASADMQVQPASMAPFAQFGADLITHFKKGDYGGLAALPVIASRGTGKGTGPGVNAPITSVRVGNVYDTQRRRKSALQEIYTSRVVPA